jgi:nucleoside-diphosphate-sugar epimerase
MERVLITGGGGFIGYHLACNLSAQGYRVDMVDNFSRGVRDDSLAALSEQDNVNVCHLDLLDADAVAELSLDYDMVFHLAAIIGVAHVTRAPYDVLTKNYELLRHVIELGRRQKHLRRLVFASTSEVYAGTLRHFSLEIPTPEDTPLAVTELAESRTSYMLSKIYGEAICLHAGLPVTIVRPHNFYGPRMGLSHVIPELCSKAFHAREGRLEVFSVSHKRTFCYIDDAVEMMRLLAESDQAVGETFNVGNETPETSIAELARKIIRVVGKPLTVCPQGETAGSPARRCPDMSKTAAATGYNTRVDLDEGIERTFAWYRENVFARQGLCAV